MEDCLFCNIVAGKIPSAKVYEDERVLAFMDVFPMTRGHVLVIPKQHAENLYDISETDLQNISVVSKKISQKIKEVLRADGIRISQSNGKAAGQEVMHYHLHIIPRYENDGLGLDHHGVSKPAKADMEELQQLAEQLKM